MITYHERIVRNYSPLSKIRGQYLVKTWYLFGFIVLFRKYEQQTYFQ